MSVTSGLTVDGIYEHFKTGRGYIYEEVKHCKMLINSMMDKDGGCISHFCLRAMISEQTFYLWVRKYEIFASVYAYCKILAKQIWFEEGRQIRDKDYQMGTVNYAMEHWRLMGWSKFGISKNSKIKINFDAESTPAEHYREILRQAANGDFTAAEFKQLMEAVNVGLNVHQTFELQKQIDELKSDLETMTANSHVENTFTDKGPTKED